MTNAPENLISALQARKAGLASIYATADDAWKEHLDIWDATHGYYGKKAAQAAITEAGKLRELGQVYFDDGYRLHQTPRTEIWRSIQVPDGAVAWELSPAGHRALSECHRLVYVTRK